MFLKFITNNNRMFSTCSEKKHKWHSPYDKNKVPIEQFKNRYSDKLYRQCNDCRQVKQKSRRKVEAYRKNIATEKNQKICSMCFTQMDKETIYKTCTECRKRTKTFYEKEVLHTNKIKLEHMLKMECCCYHCKQIFLKQPTGVPGFVVTNAKFETIDTNTIEFQMCEFDHLTELEQISRFGQSYGPKIKGIGEFTSYESKQKEAKKCQLLCLFCHAKRTQQQRDNNRVDKFSYTKKETDLKRCTDEKRNFVNNLKLKIGRCQQCEFFDPNILQCFEFDHIDQSTKVATIATLVGSYASMKKLKLELEKCRLLCRFCHRNHSAKQNIGNTKLKWIQK